MRRWLRSSRKKARLPLINNGLARPDTIVDRSVGATGLGLILFLAAAIPFVGAAETPDEIPSLVKQRLPLYTDDRSQVVGGLTARGLLLLDNPVFKDVRFSQLSGIAWDEDEQLLYAVSDKGALFHLRPIIKQGRLTDVRLVNAEPLMKSDNSRPLRGWETDAEDLALVNHRNGIRGDTELIVSFERSPRLVRYRPDGQSREMLDLPLALRDRERYQSSNKMLEAVCHDAQLGYITTAEAPLEDYPAGETLIYNLAGETWRYPLTKDNRITSLSCLGKRRLLVLERRFNRHFGISAIAIRQTTLSPNRQYLLDAHTLTEMEKDMGLNIDNFEGLSQYRDNLFFMISDNNDLFFQRTLLLFFELKLQESKASVGQ
jgi:hypothetical protein